MSRQEPELETLPHLLFFFIDGVGMGDEDPARNPFTAPGLPFLPLLPANPFVAGSRIDVSPWLLVPLDPLMDTPGLPQSATGQTALFTGCNACRVTGRHIEAFPTPRLRELILRRSLLKDFAEAGLAVTGANAYSREYFAMIEAHPLYELSASTLAIQAAGLPLRMLDELEAGRAVYHDLDNAGLHRFYPDFPLFGIEQAAANLAGIVRAHDLTLFEYFLTDKAGHLSLPAPERIVRNLLEFLEALVRLLDPGREALLVVSDHGNLEDLGTRSHTTNAVPALLYSGHEGLRQRFRAPGLPIHAPARILRECYCRPGRGPAVQE